jgi:hypothetical protein
MEKIESSLTEISILGSDMFGVIVIPQGSGGLSIGIVIVFVRANTDGIFSPPIERCPAYVLSALWLPAYLDDWDILYEP